MEQGATNISGIPFEEEAGQTRGEKSFSVLERVKNYLRSTMGAKTKLKNMAIHDRKKNQHQEKNYSRVIGITTRVLLLSWTISLQAMTPGVGSVCIGRRQFGCRRSPGLLLTNTWPSLTPRQNLLSSEKTLDLHSILHTNGVTNSNDLESVEYILQSVWLGGILEVTNSNSSLCHYSTNCSFNFCHRCNMSYNPTLNAAVCPLSNCLWLPGTWSSSSSTIP
ncbi:hypothetical protein TNCV_4577321 [Trichonephila clavipes]|nr:hypothetical protein TNCV_4577321 [Trichonephila clavipes]